MEEMVMAASLTIITRDSSRQTRTTSLIEMRHIKVNSCQFKTIRRRLLSSAVDYTATTKLRSRCHQAPSSGVGWSWTSELYGCDHSTPPILIDRPEIHGRLLECNGFRSDGTEMGAAHPNCFRAHRMMKLRSWSEPPKPIFCTTMACK